MMDFVKFSSVDPEFDSIAQIFDRHRAILQKLLPFADLQHVGSTSVPGSLSKGDLDIQIRVPLERFVEADETLARYYGRNTGSGRTKMFSSFQNDDLKPPLGLQLTAIAGPEDNFHLVRNFLIAHPHVNDEYNHLKRQFDGKSMNEYRQAKAVFFQTVLKRIFPTIAIDGPTASGKGTLARRVAAEFGFDWLDTGLLYRAVGLAVLNREQDPANPDHAVQAARDLHDELTSHLDDPGLRREAAGNAASKVAAIPGVRAALLDLQQKFVAAPPGGKGSVLDGRDVGTVVCPDAAVKIFVTAEVEIRARRRWKELQEKGAEAMYEAVLQDLKQRDARDSQREIAPLKPADDAVLLDVSHLDADQALAAALRIIKPVLAGRGRDASAAKAR